MALAPLSGEYAELGNSLLYSLQLALDEIGDKEVFIIPKNSGFNNKEKMNTAIKDFKSQDIKVIIGPLSNKEFDEVKKHTNTFYISFKYFPNLKQHNKYWNSLGPINSSK